MRCLPFDGLRVFATLRRSWRSRDASLWRSKGWFTGDSWGKRKSKLEKRNSRVRGLTCRGLVDEDVGVGGLDAVHLLDAVEDAFGQGFLVGGFDQDEDVGAAPAGVGALDARELTDGLDDGAALPGTAIDL